MAPSETLVHDHSTLHGKITIWIHRLKWNLIFPLSILGAIVLLVLIAVRNDNYEKFKAERSAFGVHTFQNGHYEFEGTALAAPTKKSNNFSEFIFENDADRHNVISITISNAQIDAEKFSPLLKQFPNLESIIIDNVTISGDFPRIYLPKLKKFYLNILLEDKKGDTYKSFEKLYSLLFFDKRQNQTLDLNNEDLGMEISVVVSGRKLIDINKSTRQLTINGPYCDDILQNIRGYFGKLSLSTCNISKSSLSADDLISINLRKIRIQDGDLREILKKFIFLEKLIYYEQFPGKKIYLNDLPPNLISLSLGSLEIVVKGENGYLVFDSIRNVSIDSVKIDAKVVDLFHDIFPNVDSVAIFGPIAANYQKLVRNILKTNATTIVLGNFEWQMESNESVVESFLKKIGISNLETNILISSSESGDQRYGSSLTDQQKNYFQYTLSGAEDFENFESYLTD